MTTQSHPDAFQTRPTLPPMPRQIARLPVHRGYPVPWFVAVINGVPDFRVVDEQKHFQAIKRRRCLICGGKLGDEFAFPIGPMCAVNRLSAEAPSHVDCVTWSAIACPFLSRPNMIRRKGNEPEGHKPPPGEMIERNPGVALVWVTTTYKLLPANGGMLFEIGKPKRVTAYREGRLATEQELIDAIASGFPTLYRAALEGGREAGVSLVRQVGNAAVALRLNSQVLDAACTRAVAPGAQS